MSVFQKGLYYRGFCWLCMRNSLPDDVNFTLIEFRNAQQYSNRKQSTFTFTTLDKKCYFVYICLICLIYICLISNYSNSVLLLRLLLLQIYPFIHCLIKKTKELLIVQHTIKCLSSREHPRVHLCYAALTFMLFHYSLFLKFVNNFEIPCQDNEFTLEVEFTL